MTGENVPGEGEMTGGGGDALVWPPLYGILFPISSKGSFISIITQTTNSTFL